MKEQTIQNNWQEERREENNTNKCRRFVVRKRETKEGNAYHRRCAEVSDRGGRRKKIVQCQCRN